MGAYAAAPGEQVLRLSVTSSLFPHLPHRSPHRFRIGLAVLFLALIAFALLRWQAPMIVVSALGLPLMFLLYLHEADVHRDLPIRSSVTTAVLGVGLGVGWALLTGTVVADFYDVRWVPANPEGGAPCGNGGTGRWSDPHARPSRGDAAVASGDP